MTTDQRQDAETIPRRMVEGSFEGIPLFDRLVFIDFEAAHLAATICPFQVGLVVTDMHGKILTTLTSNISLPEGLYLPREEFGNWEHRINARPIREIVEEIEEMLDGNTPLFVAHHAGWDRNLFYQALLDDSPLFKSSFIDTKNLARILLDDCDCESLGAIAGILGIKIPDNLHNPLVDAQLCRTVFTRLIEIMREKNINSWHHLLTIGRIGWGDKRNPRASFVHQLSFRD